MRGKSICYLGSCGKFIDTKTGKTVRASTAVNTYGISRMNACKLTAPKKTKRMAGFKQCKAAGQSKRVIKGKTRCVRTGPKGGKYYMSKGKKVYIR